MEGPRAPTASEFPELVRFLDSNLRAQNGWSIADEYPTAINVHNLNNFRIIKDSQKILSHALMRPLIVKTRRGLFKVGCIGSVVTSEENRNQGLSQSVLSECVANLKSQNCDIAVLWTNLFEFYRKLGFELAGSEISLLVDRPIPERVSGLKIVSSNRVDAQALFRVYSKHSVFSIRTLEDFEKYLKIPNSRLHTAWNKDGQLEAYVVEGKGADLQGYIHEWGGSVDGVVALTNNVRLAIGRPVTLIAPAHSVNLIRRLEGFGIKHVDGFLGMIKLVNPQSFFSKIIKNSRQEWGIENFVLEQRDGFFLYGVGDQLFKTDHESDIIRLIFGPQKSSQVHDCGPEINAILDRFLPIEMWLWGWDSI